MTPQQEVPNWFTELPNIERDMRLAVMCRVLVSCGDVPAAEMEEARAWGIRIGEA